MADLISKRILNQAQVFGDSDAGCLSPTNLRHVQSWVVMLVCVAKWVNFLSLSPFKRRNSSALETEPNIMCFFSFFSFLAGQPYIMLDKMKRWRWADCKIVKVSMERGMKEKYRRPE